VTWAAVIEYTGIRHLFEKCVKGYNPDKVTITQKEITQKIYNRKMRERMKQDVLDSRKIEKKMFGTGTVDGASPV
jgi:hypothetical protein